MEPEKDEQVRAKPTSKEALTTTQRPADEDEPQTSPVDITKDRADPKIAGPQAQREVTEGASNKQIGSERASASEVLDQGSSQTAAAAENPNDLGQEGGHVLARRKIVEFAKLFDAVKTFAVVIAFFVGGAVFALNYFVQRTVFQSEITKVYEALSAENAALRCAILQSDLQYDHGQHSARKDAMSRHYMGVISEVNIKAASGELAVYDEFRKANAEGMLEFIEDSYATSEANFNRISQEILASGQCSSP